MSDTGTDTRTYIAIEPYKGMIWKERDVPPEHVDPDGTAGWPTFLELCTSASLAALQALRSFDIEPELSDAEGDLGQVSRFLTNLSTAVDCWKATMYRQEQREETPYSGEISREDILEEIRGYEQEFGMSSEEFMQAVQAGTAPDTFETMAWMIMLRHR